MGLTKIEFKSGKVYETPAATGVAEVANGFDSIAATIASAKEKDNNVINLAPSATDVVISMSNITSAELCILLSDGPISIKVNGSVVALDVNPLFVISGSNVTGITASNPSATEARQVHKYLATSTD